MQVVNASSIAFSIKIILSVGINYLYTQIYQSNLFVQQFLGS